MNCVTAGNIMVQLFLQTQPKYQLNNKKLQYLLCIAQLVSLSNGQELFEDNIRNLKNDFSLEPIADNFFCNSDIQEGTVSDKSLNLSFEDFHIPYSAKKIYCYKEFVSEEQKKLLIDVFIWFGAYKEKTLCKMLNEFTPLRSLPIWTDITKENINDFFTSSFENGAAYKNNKIFSLCKEYAPSKVENIVEEKVDKEIVLSTPTELPTIPQKTEVLKDYAVSSLKDMVTNNKYSIYIETELDKPVKDVVIIALNNNIRVLGTLKKFNDTLYCYSFTGVPSDIKISVDF